MQFLISVDRYAPHHLAKPLKVLLVGDESLVNRIIHFHHLLLTVPRPEPKVVPVTPTLFDLLHRVIIRFRVYYFEIPLLVLAQLYELVHVVRYSTLVHYFYQVLLALKHFHRFGGCILDGCDVVELALEVLEQGLHQAEGAGVLGKDDLLLVPIISDLEHLPNDFLGAHHFV